MVVAEVDMGTVVVVAEVDLGTVVVGAVEGLVGSNVISCSPAPRPYRRQVRRVHRSNEPAT